MADMMENSQAPELMLRADRLSATWNTLRLARIPMTSGQPTLRSRLVWAAVRLEGRPIDPDDVTELLESDTKPANLSPDLMVALSYAEAWDLAWEWIETKRRIDSALIRGLHARCMNRVNSLHAGQYRRSEAYLQHSRQVAPAPGEVCERIEGMCDWMDQVGSSLHPLFAAAWIHAILLTIHPFVDGNGRIGRLLTDIVLGQRGFPPILWDPTRREDYVAALGEGDQGNILPLVEAILDGMERTVLI